MHRRQFAVVFGCFSSRAVGGRDSRTIAAGARPRRVSRCRAAYLHCSDREGAVASRARPNFVERTIGLCLSVTFDAVILPRIAFKEAQAFAARSRNPIKNSIKAVHGTFPLHSRWAMSPALSILQCAEDHRSLHALYLKKSKICCCPQNTADIGQS